MRSLAAGLLVVAAACGGSKSRAGDAGTDGTSDAADLDAAPDGPPEAAPCTSVDTDGDGVCDALDRCPAVPDPGQADLDNDQVGWMCDPVESVTVSGDGAPAFVQTSIYEDTFAARTKLQCSGQTCGHVLVQVGASGQLIARSDSTLPVDAWHASASWMDGPIVTPHGRVLWSRGYANGDIGDFDLATKQYTSRATGAMNPDDPRTQGAVYSGGALLAVATQTATLAQTLVDVRTDGTLPVLHSAQVFHPLSGNPNLAIPGSPPRAFVNARSQFMDSLKLYSQGSATLEEILVAGQPLTNLLTGLETIRIDGVAAGFCVHRNDGMFAVMWDSANNIVSYQLPITSCLSVVGTDRGAARILMSGARPIGFIYAGTFRPLALGTLSFEVRGSTLPVVLMSFTDAYLIDATGALSQLSSGFDGGVASVVGNTVHLLVHRDHPGTLGDYVVERHRSGQPVQAVTVATDVPNGIAPLVVTTFEGAALVHAQGDFVVPSQSMTAIASPVGEMDGGIRDGRTVVFARNTLTTMGGAYAYSEVNGAPQFTLLDTAGLAMEGHVLEEAGHDFVYKNAATGCRVARFAGASGNTLQSIACVESFSFRVIGTRADGVVLARDGTYTYALSSTAAQRIGPSGQAVFETDSFPRVVVAWTGQHNGNNQFACLAMEPQRCWTWPSGGIGEERWRASAAGTGRFEYVRSSQPAVGQVTFTVVRSIGPGNVSF